MRRTECAIAIAAFGAFNYRDEMPAARETSSCFQLALVEHAVIRLVCAAEPILQLAVSFRELVSHLEEPFGDRTIARMLCKPNQLSHREKMFRDVPSAGETRDHGCISLE
jgi:hypothetical protein